LELVLNPQLMEYTFYVNDVSSPETEVLMTYDDQDNYKAAYAYGYERIEVQALDDTRPESQDPLYYLYDGLGSVSQMIRPNGAVRDHYGYGVPAPGAKLSEDGRNVNHNAFGYTGEMWDEEDNLLYLRSRYYMPEVGRFVNRDVFPGFAENPLSMHKYAYVENNPVNWVDPLGFNKKDQKVFYGPPSPAQIYGPPNPFVETDAFVDNWQLLDGYTQGTGNLKAPVSPNSKAGGNNPKITSNDVGKVGNVTTISEGALKGFELTDAAKTMGRANFVMNLAQTGLDGYEQTQKQQPVWKGVAKTAGHFAINAGTGFVVGSLAVAHGAAYVGTFGPEAPLTYPVITLSGGASIYATIKAGDKLQSTFDDWIDN